MSSEMENDISTWDPMKEDFFDPTFNTYCQGPGSKLDRKLQPCFSRTEGERPVFRLYVGNVSSGLNEEGIKNVFLHFGKPFDIYRQPPCGGPGWAMVSFATHREAEMAIRKLHNLPPFHFRVQFARSPEEKERIRQEKAKEELLRSVLENEPYPVQTTTTSPLSDSMVGFGRGRALPFRHRLPERRPGNLQFDKNPLIDEYVGFYSPFVPGVHYETNRILMQGIDIIINSPLGKRRVSGGRGYSLVSTKSVHQDLNMHSKNAMYDVADGVYEKGTLPPITELSGKCLYCHELTTHYCQRCHDWYCTRDCQMADWPDHKFVCLPETTEKEDIDLPAHLSTQDKEFLSKSVNQIEMPDSLNLSIKARFPNLSLDSFTCVKVTVPINSTECWAQFVDCESELGDLLAVLNDGHEDSAINIVKPDMLCAGLFENFWFRAKVICIEPQLRVLYIDYGNEEVCSIDQLKSIPLAIKDIPPMALKIKLAEEKSGKYHNLFAEEILKVKPVGMQDDAVVVHVEGEVYSDLFNDQELPSSEQLKESSSFRKKYDGRDVNHIKKHMIALANMTVGMTGGCLLQQKFIGGDVAATIVCPSLRSELSLLDHELRSLKSEIDRYNPSIGEMVAVKSAIGNPASEKEMWLRGYVLAIGTVSYRVNLCDLGKVVTVSRVQRLPDNLKQIPEFAVRCILAESIKNQKEDLFKESEQFLFTVESLDENLSVNCILKTKTGKEIGKATLKPWVPTAEDEGLKTVLLKDQDKVILSVLFDLTSLFVRPAGVNDKKVFAKIQQDVYCQCLTAPILAHIPRKNDIVACKFEEDGNYYRAQVLEVEKETIKVAFIDFGNQIVVERSRLKPLTDDLKKIPAMAVKIMLNNIKDKPLTRSLGELMSTLIGEQVELTLTKCNLPGSGVELFLPNGESLNNKINACFDLESSKLENKSREFIIYKEFDMQFLELPLDETIEFAVLHKLDSVTFMGCDANGGDIIDYVFGAMSTNLHDYCESTPDESYVPRIEELCFARSSTNGRWYRAVCIGDGLTRENNVLFLDFGNMEFVDKANIRRMTQEFAETPCVAVLCTLKGLTSENASEEQKQKIDELVLTNEIYKANVISRGETGTYIIEFPHVTEALVKEGLLG